MLHTSMQGFSEALSAHRPQLEKIYRELLGSSYEAVQRLNSEKLVHTQEEKMLVQPVTDFLKYLKQDELLFFLQANELVQLDEVLTHDLDRRVLSRLGYDPTPWMELAYADLDKHDQMRIQGEKRMRNTKRLSDNELITLMRTWRTQVVENEGIGYNFLQSTMQYRLKKVRPDEVPNIEEMVRAGRGLGFGNHHDNYAGASILSPDPKQIHVASDGKLKLEGTSRLVTTPLIVLSERGVQQYLVEQLRGSDMPLYLLAAIHEFNHFVGYCIEDFPIITAAGILSYRAIRDLRTQQEI
jgi:hypothetical protein